MDGDIDNDDLSINEDDLFDSDDVTLEVGDINNKDAQELAELSHYGNQITSSPSYTSFHENNKAHDLDVKIYYSILVAYSCKEQSNLQDRLSTTFMLQYSLG